MCFLVSAANLYHLIGDGADVPGIYKLRCLDEAIHRDEAIYKYIPRLLMEDPDGVLYIGSSANVRGRIMALRISLCTAAGEPGFINGGCHPCGQKYSHAVQAQIPFSSLCVTVHTLQQHPEYGNAAEYEVAELSNYQEIFGEVPPFNAIGG